MPRFASPNISIFHRKSSSPVRFSYKTLSGDPIYHVRYRPPQGRPHQVRLIIEDSHVAVISGNQHEDYPLRGMTVFSTNDARCFGWLMTQTDGGGEGVTVHSFITSRAPEILAELQHRVEVARLKANE